MSAHPPIMQVQENGRTGKRGDSWTVLVEGVADDAAGSVSSWREAQEMAAAKHYLLEPPAPGLRREMVEAGVPRDQFGESTGAALFSHPHGSPDI